MEQRRMKTTQCIRGHFSILLESFDCWQRCIVYMLLCQRLLFIFDIEWLKASTPFHCYELMQPNWIWNGPQNAVKQGIYTEWVSMNILFFSFYCYRFIIWCCYANNVRSFTLFFPHFFETLCKSQQANNSDNKHKPIFRSLILFIQSTLTETHRDTQKYIIMGDGFFVIFDSCKRTKL